MCDCDRGTILALRYEGAPPAPHPQCSCPTPDDMAALACERKARRSLEQAAVDAEKRDAPTVVGQVGGLLSTAVHAVAHVVQQSKDAQVRDFREWEHKQGEEKFAMNFPDLAEAGEGFIVQYAASVMSKGICERGHILLTEHYIAFVSDTIKDLFPIKDILSIQRSIKCKTANNRTPVFLPVPQHYIVADCVQLFMREQHKVLQFVEFDCPEKQAEDTTTAEAEGTMMMGAVKSLPIDRFYNWLDHLWRKATTVPVEGVHYAHLYTQQYERMDLRNEVYCDARSSAVCLALKMHGLPCGGAHPGETAATAATFLPQQKATTGAPIAHQLPPVLRSDANR